MTGADLTRASTLRVPSRAERVVPITRNEDLAALLAELRGHRRNRAPAVTVLGGGSNVVLRREIPGVVCLMRTRGIAVASVRRGAEITAAAGERWHDLVRFSLGRGLAGLENLALIPGSTGAAPIQNIGAYGVELAERFVRLSALDPATGRIHRFDAGACGFSYRNSYFKSPEGKGLVILDVTLRVSRHAQLVTGYPDLELELARSGVRAPSPVQVAEAVIRVRRRKLPDPRRIGNAGSFFKNPLVTADQADALRDRLPGLTAHRGADGGIKLSAAQLIDACGWKGRTLGGAGVWPRQPLVLVNRGGATAALILELAERIRSDVAERFAVHLELEPEVIGGD